jgi:GTP-binding protein Era
MNQTNHKTCGFIAILGAPNAGKSTLLNNLVGSKVAIVTPKAQTTRSRVLGIVIKDQSQLILVDTPGIFKPKHRFDRAMVKAAWSASGDADIVAVIVDVHAKSLEKTETILDQLATMGHEPILVLNKIDQVKRLDLLAIAQRLTKERKIRETFMISALNGDGIVDLLNYLAKHLPEGPWLFPEDQLTDMPQRLIAAEITREKIFMALHEELPYAITVHSDSWEEFKNGSVKITQTIYVMRESQKSIVVGKDGHQIKQISQRAREDMADFFGRPVHLFLHVKTQENWVEKREHYREIGLDYDA